MSTKKSTTKKGAKARGSKTKKAGNPRIMMRPTAGTIYWKFSHLRHSRRDLPARQAPQYR